MAYSSKCDLTRYWFMGKCIRCQSPEPGHEITPNCGYGDDGSRHEKPFKQCKDNFFNDGKSFYCKPCTPCPSGLHTVRPCSSTADDTECRAQRSITTEFPARETTTHQRFSTFFSKTYATKQVSSVTAVTLSSSVPWALPFAIIVSIMLVTLSACLIYKKWKRGVCIKGWHANLNIMNSRFTSLPSSSGNDLENILSPDIVSAPLQTVLDNLDVLEELVILLDPESHGVKNTRHLASQCSFTSTWITYTYSMKDIKSPLKAVLEGVTSKHPEWTVGDLANLLRHMERNDAITVLAKLSQ